MFKKLAIGIACVLILTAGAALAGCGGDTDYDEKFSDKVKIVYELEGGKYRNSTTSVSHYYDYSPNLKITPLEDKKFSDDGVTRDGGFVLEGWYTTKTVNADGTVVYENRWDFAFGTVPREGVTLYAKWKSPVSYTFDFVYIGDDGAEHVVKSYDVNAGNKFGDVYPRDVLSYASGYAGHTAIGVYNDPEHKVPFDNSIVHPGGEESCAVKLYVEYVEGSYTVVRTAEELKSARRSIYLLADIDLDGEAFSFENFDNKKLLGNGHTISNFKLSYGAVRDNLVANLDDGNKDAIYIALFGAVENAEVKDVVFENVTVTVKASYTAIKKIYVAPLAVTAKNSKFENVTVKGAFGYDTLPEGFNTGDLIFVTDKGTYRSENSNETGCVYEITLAGKK